MPGLRLTAQPRHLGPLLCSAGGHMGGASKGWPPRANPFPGMAQTSTLNKRRTICMLRTIMLVHW